MKQKWKFEDIPDLSGKTIIVTGGNSGLGFEAVKSLSAKGPETIWHNGICVNDDNCKPDMYGNVYCDPIKEDALIWQIERNPLPFALWLIIPTCTVIITALGIWRKKDDKKSEKIFDIVSSCNFCHYGNPYNWRIFFCRYPHFV